MLSVSVGALPRPAPGEHSCRKGGPLAVTDASLLLGRLIPSYFPKIFGKSESEPLDHEASRRAFEELAERINSDPGIAKRMKPGRDRLWMCSLLFFSARELAVDAQRRPSFIKVANETMCRPIRALTESRGFATSKHM